MRLEGAGLSRVREMAWWASHRDGIMSSRSGGIGEEGGTLRRGGREKWQTEGKNGFYSHKEREWRSPSCNSRSGRSAEGQESVLRPKVVWCVNALS